MNKEATLQVRMQSDVKASVEELYNQLGTSFAEAVRIFARQSLAVGGMPFVIQLKPEVTRSTFGAARKYASAEKRALESVGCAWKAAVKGKWATHA